MVTLATRCKKHGLVMVTHEWHDGVERAHVWCPVCEPVREQGLERA